MVFGFGRRRGTAREAPAAAKAPVPPASSVKTPLDFLAFLKARLEADGAAVERLFYESDRAKKGTLARPGFLSFLRKTVGEGNTLSLAQVRYAELMLAREARDLAFPWFVTSVHEGCEASDAVHSADR